MQLIDSQTYINLARSFAGECQAQTRYKFIEYGARMQNLNCLAEIIDKVIYNEFNHARILYTHIQKASNKTITNIDVCMGTPFKQKWDLADNLLFAAEDEADEVKIYLDFVKTAKEEGFNDIAATFKMLSDVEKSHNKLFMSLFEQMDANTMYKREKPVKWKCSACGFEATAEKAFDTCPLCQAKQGQVLLHV